jgi:hypothetical protein
VALTLAGCGDRIGTPCEITGSGFTASHNCASKCLSRWTLTCPDGSAIQPKVCAGQSDCAPGGCPQGQACYHFDDAFDEVSYCVPADICGAAVSEQAVRAWEIASDQSAAASRAAQDERERRRQQAIDKGQPQTTRPAQPLPEPDGS